jgi:prolyl-tRNA synthetase
MSNTVLQVDNPLSITIAKDDNFGEWYRQIVTKCKFIMYYDISGFYPLLPNSYYMWEQIQHYLNKEFKDRDVKNVYFPLLVTQSNLLKEESHIEGFMPEVLWIGKMGDTTPVEKLAVRPTSETIFYPLFKNLIVSHNDLPLKYNQWSNVIRCEFSEPTPFIRSKEFLWQEGHTCHRTLDEALNETTDIIKLYKQTYKNLLAIPTIIGNKTEKEKFAGAITTKTIEGFIPGCNKAIQAATSHCLGQNFSTMFDIKFQDTDQVNKLVYQNSWGFTTRSIGVSIMTHSDNKGAVIPPFIAPLQIVIIPILFKKNKEDTITYVDTIYNRLKPHFTVSIDNTVHNPGWKFNYWELMGVPLRFEIGPKDCQNNSITMVRRDTLEKTSLVVNDNLVNNINTILTNMHDAMYNKAKQHLIESIIIPNSKIEMEEAFTNNKLCLLNWCGNQTCEDSMKELYKVKSLCIPDDDEFDQLFTVQTDKCVSCNTSNVASEGSNTQGVNFLGSNTQGVNFLGSNRDNKLLCLFGKSY